AAVPLNSVKPTICVGLVGAVVTVAPLTSTPLGTAGEDPGKTPGIGSCMPLVTAPLIIGLGLLPETKPVRFTVSLASPRTHIAWIGWPFAPAPLKLVTVLLSLCVSCNTLSGVRVSALLPAPAAVLPISIVSIFAR